MKARKPAVKPVAPVAPVIQRSPQERLDSRYTYIMGDLNGYVKAGTDAALEIAKKITESAHPFAALTDLYGWGTGAIEAASAHVAYVALEWVTHHEKTVGKYEALNRGILDAISECRRSLLRNEYRGGSTNQFHNARDDATREARGRMLDRLERMQLSLQECIDAVANAPLEA